MKILTSGKVNRKLDCRYCGTIVELSREEANQEVIMAAILQSSKGA